MSRAATKTGTKRSRAMELDQLRTAAHRHFPDASGSALNRQVARLHKIARAGRLRLNARPTP